MHLYLFFKLHTKIPRKISFSFFSFVWTSVKRFCIWFSFFRFAFLLLLVYFLFTWKMCFCSFAFRWFTCIIFFSSSLIQSVSTLLFSFIIYVDNFPCNFLLEPLCKYFITFTQQLQQNLAAQKRQKSALKIRHICLLFSFSQRFFFRFRYHFKSMYFHVVV